jgi:hypothetical protein
VDQLPSGIGKRDQLDVPADEVQLVIEFERGAFTICTLAPDSDTVVARDERHVTQHIDWPVVLRPGRQKRRGVGWSAIDP